LRLTPQRRRRRRRKLEGEKKTWEFEGNIAESHIYALHDMAKSHSCKWVSPLFLCYNIWLNQVFYLQLNMISISFNYYLIKRILNAMYYDVIGCRVLKITIERFRWPKLNDYTSFLFFFSYECAHVSWV
jgi:hypothetical protein